MERINREAIVTQFFVRLKTMPKHLLAKLRKTTPLESDAAALEIAERLAECVDNDYRMVIGDNSARPDPFDHLGRRA